MYSYVYKSTRILSTWLHLLSQDDQFCSFYFLPHIKVTTTLSTNKEPRVLFFAVVNITFLKLNSLASSFLVSFFPKHIECNFVVLRYANSMNGNTIV